MVRGLCLATAIGVAGCLPVAGRSAVAVLPAQKRRKSFLAVVVRVLVRVWLLLLDLRLCFAPAVCTASLPASGCLLVVVATRVAGCLPRVSLTFVVFLRRRCLGAQAMRRRRKRGAPAQRAKRRRPGTKIRAPQGSRKLNYRVFPKPQRLNFSVIPKP